MYDKKVLWNKVSQICLANDQDKVCLIGDFNYIQDDSERANFSYRRSDSEGFNHLINNANLLDLALLNDQFTWFGPLGRKSRLDRALVNSSWWDEAN